MRTWASKPVYVADWERPRLRTSESGFSWLFIGPMSQQASPTPTGQPRLRASWDTSHRLNYSSASLRKATLPNMQSKDTNWLQRKWLHDMMTVPSKLRLCKSEHWGCSWYRDLLVVLSNCTSPITQICQQWTLLEIHCLLLLFLLSVLFQSLHRVLYPLALPRRWRFCRLT